MTPSPVAWSSAAVGSSQTIRRGLVDQRARDRDALLLAAGELRGKRIGAFARPSLSRSALARSTGLLPGVPPRGAAPRRSPRRSTTAGGCTAGTRTRGVARGKATLSLPERVSRLVPSTVTSPAVRSRRPAITEMSVVFPQPLGPTRKLSSPKER